MISEGLNPGGGGGGGHGPRPHFLMHCAAHHSRVQACEDIHMHHPSIQSAQLHVGSLAESIDLVQVLAAILNL